MAEITPAPLKFGSNRPDVVIGDYGNIVIGASILVRLVVGIIDSVRRHSLQIMRLAFLEKRYTY